ncbi:hypothetical protein AVEN_86999-1, partial [Araneus ventricosus]
HEWNHSGKKLRLPKSRRQLMVAFWHFRWRVNSTDSLAG